MPLLLRNVLPREFYERPTLTVAEDLLGKVLVCRSRGKVTAGMIVEVEAYVGEDDPACHACRGPTPRNAPLYGLPGFAYVYLNYGMHHLVNAVTEAIGRPAAVLIRALEPVDGVSTMMRRRQAGGAQRIAEAHVCRGPGNLSRALGISLLDNQRDLTGDILSIEDRQFRRAGVSWGPRVGIRVGVDRPWRCWMTGHPAVSAPRIQAPDRALRVRTTSDPGHGKSTT